MLTKQQIAQRIARELQDGFYVNLGIGIPTLVANYVPEEINVTLQSENGLLGMGPFPTEEEIDADLINAGKQTVTTLPGSAFFDSATSGNLIFKATARNFNPMMAMAGKITIAEVEELVPAGELDPNFIHTPGIFVNKIFQGVDYEKRIEQRTIR